MVTPESSMTESLPLHEALEDDIQVQLARVFNIAGCRTQVELAEVLGIRQSSIADAKRRGRIPPGWLITLLRSRGVHPDWITRGARPKFLINTPLPDESAPDQASGHDPETPLVRRLLCCFSLRDLTGELARRRMLPDGAQGK